MRNVWMVLLLLSQVSIGQDFNMRVLDKVLDSNLIASSGNIRYNEVWGFHHGGLNYAVIGSTEGVHIYKIENKQLVNVDSAHGRFRSEMVIHRDYAVFEDHLYAVCDEGPSSLQIFDLTYLSDSIHKVYDDNTEVGRAHNVWVDSAAEVLYVAGTPMYALMAFDISTTPENPTLINTYSGVNYVHDLYARNDTIFAYTGSYGMQILKLVGNQFHFLGELSSYQEQGYNHSGWLSPNGKRMIFADETEGKRLKFLDVSDVSNPQVLSLFGEIGDEYHIAHNPMMDDKYIYVAYYRDGLSIYSYNDQESTPKLVAKYNPFIQESSLLYDGVWGVYKFPNEDYLVFSDQQNGLFLMEFNPPEKIEASTMEVFPNPASSSVNIIWNDYNSEASMEISNTYGQKVLQKDVSNNTWTSIDVSNWVQGVYSVKLFLGDTIYNYKFIVQR